MEPDAEDTPSAAATSSSSSSNNSNNSNNTSSSGISTSATTPGRGSPGIKCCSGCQTTKTPLWRGGPDGPKSLCNACGIRYRKRRREVLGITDDHPDIPASASAAALTATNKKRKHTAPNRPKPAAAAAKVNMLRVFPKQADRLLDQRLLLWLNTRQRHSRLREEEQAAVLLMALSCGILYA